MVIEEHVSGYIMFTNGDEFYFDDSNIIDDDISITQQATADNSFSLGGVYSSTLSMTIRITDIYTNSFNIIGSKIILYSRYGSEQTPALRGIFWVTSATKYKDIYTLNGSDALIWFDNTIYDDSNNRSIAKILYELFVWQSYSLKDCLSVVCDTVSKNLVDRNASTIIANTSNFVWNNVAPHYSDYNCGHYTITDECANALETASARDYLSYLAQIGAGFIECQYDGGNPSITIATFEDNFFEPTELKFQNCEENSVELADFRIKCIRGYVEVYSGASASWKTQSAIDYKSNCYFTIDLTGNPFVDGNWANTVRSSDGDHSCTALLSSLCNLFGDSYTFNKGDGIAGNYFIHIAPFKLIYHSEERFHLGQRVRVPNSDGTATGLSVITKIVWNFRGGYELSCAGADNRMLYDSARRTPSKRAKEEAISKAIYLADELNRDLASQWDTLQSQIGDLNSATSGNKGDLISQWNTIQEQIGKIYDCIDILKQDLINQGLYIS